MSSESATTVSMELLRTLHRIQRQRSDLKSQLERGPRQIQAGERLFAQHREAVEAAVGKLKSSKLAADEKQLQLKSREDRISQLEAKLNTAASNREYTLLKEQIAADRQANDVLSDEILEALERIDVLEAERAELQQDLQQREQDQAAMVEKVNAKLEKLAVELARVESELLVAEEQMPASLLVDYRRIVAARGEEALAPVEGENCGGCFQTLTSQMMNRLYLGQAVRCPSCGAMMYLAEDRTVR
ncbi:zinc ribbon domain-containing protein [Planctomycetaceae bacterium SH139]